MLLVLLSAPCDEKSRSGHRNSAYLILQLVDYPATRDATAAVNRI